MIFVMKKLDLTPTSFAELMALPARTFQYYPNIFPLFKFLRTVLNALRGKGIMYS
jgi:hypothetical protein